MDFSGFVKSNPELLGKAMGALGGGQKEEGPPPPRDAQPGIEGVRQQQDTGDKGYSGFKNVVKTVASFWAGGPAAGAIAQNAVGTAAGGKGGPAPAQSTTQAASTNYGSFGGGGYSATAQQAQEQPWLQRFGGGYAGG